MYRFEEVAVTYETDWTGGAWAIAIALGVLALAYVLAAPFIAGALLNAEGRRGIGWLWALGAVVLIAAWLVLLILPGGMMRHIPDHASVWWVAVPCLVLAAVLAIRGALMPAYDPLRWVLWVPALTLFAGTVTGLILDALNRAAAAVPMGVGTFAAIVIAGGAALALSAASRRA